MFTFEVQPPPGAVRRLSAGCPRNPTITRAFGLSRVDEAGPRQNVKIHVAIDNLAPGRDISRCGRCRTRTCDLFLVREAL
jgi:hypothetical protein